MVELLAGLPEGTVELTTTRWRAAEGDGERIGLTPPSRDLDAGALAERTADELTAAVRLEDWPSPTLPRPVAGGWIHDEVVDDDRPAFESVLACRAGEGAEAVALACQELRFPVTPYRPLPAPTTPAHRLGHERSGSSTSAPTGRDRWPRCFWPRPAPRW